jgi:phenylacetate-CoA ligase
MLSRFYGTAVIGLNAMRQRGVPYLPPEKVQQLRDRRVRWMVRYAAETVPFYREWFGEQVLDPGDIHSAEDLSRLPLLDTQIVRRQPQRFVSQSKWGQTAIPFHTTGSTGAPFTAYHDRDSLLLASAAAQRESDVLRRGFGLSPAYRSVIIAALGTTAGRVDDVLGRMRFVPLGPDRLRLTIGQPVEEVVAAINQHRPHVLEGYGSYLEVLYRTISARGMSMYKPRLIVYFSDAMSDSGREWIEKGLGIPVLSRYMSIEAFRLGFTCEERHDFHLHIDLTHLEIVDGEGARCAAGQSGEVVISNLINRGMVLLNYRLGDVGAVSNERCPCGRNLPLLAQLSGRTYDVIYLADGRFVHAGAVAHVFHTTTPEQSGLLQYQLIQHDWDRYELRLATAERATFDRLVSGYVAQLSQILGPSSAIEPIYYQEQLPRGPGGKFRSVRSLLKRKEPE